MTGAPSRRVGQRRLISRIDTLRTPWGPHCGIGDVLFATGRASALSAIVADVNFGKRLRARLIGILSMALLFSQIAVAAYACPAMGERADPVSAGIPAMAGMPCAEMMASGVPLDPEQPTLCMQHCQFGSTTQVVDHVPAVFVPVTAFPALFTVPVDERLDLGLSSWAEDERLRDRPPPLALGIAHCCYRI